MKLPENLQRFDKRLQMALALCLFYAGGRTFGTPIVLSPEDMDEVMGVFYQCLDPSSTSEENVEAFHQQMAAAKLFSAEVAGNA